MSRPRRDPRAERDAHRADGDGERQRFDRLQRRSPVGSATAREPVQATAATLVKIIEAPAFWVLAVADPGTGGLSADDRATLGAARKLAGAEGGVVLVADRAVEGAGAAGADRLAVLDTADHPAAWADAVRAAMTAFVARHVVAPETPEGGDLIRRLAAGGGGFFAGVNAISGERVGRTVRSRGVDQRAPAPRFMTVAADSFAAPSGAPREGRLVERLPAQDVRDFPATERLRPSAQTLPLGEADFVVAAGNGVTDFEAFAQLAAALGATPGGSRVVCDAGLLPREAQVGASGAVLAARCYLALGIAGAPQHLQGVAGCAHVLAVNTDLHAAMIARAELAVVADAQTVMRALLRLLAEEAAR